MLRKFNRRKLFVNQKPLRNANFVHKYGLYLPNHANISKLDIDYIVKCFKSIAKPIFFNRSKNI